MNIGVTSLRSWFSPTTDTTSAAERLLQCNATISTSTFNASTCPPSPAGYNRPADVPPADYSIVGSPASITFGVFSALGTVAFAFGDTVLPEIQVWAGLHLTVA